MFGKIFRIFEIVVFAISVVFLCFLTCLCAKGQSNVMKREIVSRDTIEATSFVGVEEYTKKDGTKGYKATWCGRSININKAAANDILEGSDAYVVVARYNNGEVIRQKVITLYSK